MEHYALPAEVYGAGLVFARVGALAMLLPGVGEQTVPANVRLAFSFLLSLVLYPVVRSSLPPIPSTVDGLASQLVIEIVIGLGIGALLRMFLGALTVAGEVVSLQTTLSFAQTANPLQAQPTPTIGTFLALIGVTLVFSTDLHQLFIAAIVKSYALFAPGKGMPTGDFVSLAIRAMGETFSLGVQLAAPVIVFSLIFNIAAGLIGRAMPQFQVFFAATPLSVLLGLSVFALSLGMFGLVWVDRFRDFVGRFV
jgi:flagellar biosynthetic protein FliR